MLTVLFITTGAYLNTVPSCGQTFRYGYTLCGWIAGHESEYMETLSEQEVTQAVTQLLRRFTGECGILKSF